ncbi:MAG TPA: hypothetical protein VGQ25_02430 [Gemmatimonadales bacterium]|jgi:hypothetical protein|nr:hypothetical protein [Gemmatimonadales bacterium]
MLKPESWFVPIFVGIVIVAAAAAAACGNDTASPTLRTAADSSGGDSLPGDSTPGDTVPGDTVPHDTVPHDTVPRDTVPGDTVPHDTVPHDTVPHDTVPHDTIPPPSGPASMTVTPDSQERAVGDSGWVSATVRDSAGREIWPAAIEWDLADTSTVLRIRVLGTSFVIFDAVGPGRARLIARFQDLADTGVVVVR